LTVGVLVAESAAKDIERAGEHKDDVAAALRELESIPPEDLRSRAERVIETDAPNPWLLVPVVNEEYVVMVRPLTHAEIDKYEPELRGHPVYLVGAVAPNKDEANEANESVASETQAV
jgi:hypothetical protein